MSSRVVELTPAQLTERVRRFAQMHEMWRHDETVLVAVSGGPDSVALLDLLLTLAPAEGLRLAVGHVLHGLREEGAEDARFVAELARARRLPYLEEHVDVPARVAETGESVEGAARVLRYAAFTRMAINIKAARVATGHTADDQAETVLLRLLRGTGLSGLAGIPPVRAPYIRPLLAVRRYEVMAYLAARELAYCTDESNVARCFLRNRVRHDLLPNLEREYAPGLSQRLARLAEMARSEIEALDAWAAVEYARLREPRPDGVALPGGPPSPAAMTSSDSLLPAAIVTRLWRLAISEVRGDTQDIEYDHYAAIAALTTGQEVHLPGAQVICEPGCLVFIPGPVPPESRSDTPVRPLPVPGTLQLPALGVAISSEQVAGHVPLLGGDMAVLDIAAVFLPLIVRTWTPGDRYQPLGSHGTRKLQDVFVDAGVPRRLRSRIPLVCDTCGIVWPAGFRVADRVKVVPGTTQSLRLTVEWELNPWTLNRSVPA